MSNFILKLLNLKTLHKIFIIFFIDIFLLFFSLNLSISLRLDEIYFPNTQFFIIFFINIFIFLILSLFFKLHKTVYRYFSISEIYKYLKFIFIFTVIFFLLIVISKPLYFPRSVPLINFFIFSILIILSRFLVSTIANTFRSKESNDYFNSMSSIAIYGAGILGSHLLYTIKKESDISSIIFIDDDLNKNNRYLEGIKIFRFSELEKLIQKNKIDTIIIAITNLSHIKSDLILKLANDKNIKVLSSPNLFDQKGFTSLSELTNFKNEYFVKSKIKNTHKDNSNVFYNDIILITGGGGSIGSELSRQISYLSFKKLIIADISEFNLFKIKEDLIDLFITDPDKVKNIKFILLDLKDMDDIYNVFKQFKPSVVYHAAAYKHVPIVEHNVKIGIKNNFIGTANLIDISIEFNVRKFLFVSTDKAVNPINLMGITKRLGELYIKNVSKKTYTKSTIVRFGNVVGSSGSVIPLFINQIKNGGPVTITHEDATRYFMTIPDAVSLIINSSVISKGGEIFVLNMGEPKKILDIAKNLISKTAVISSGSYNPNDIKIQIIGLRKGEKIHEEIYTDDLKSIEENKDILILPDNKNDDQDIHVLLNSLKKNINHFSDIKIISEIESFFKKN